MLEQAQAEARKLHQEFVGTEHLTLGLLVGGESEALRLLQTHHATADRLRSSLLRDMPKEAQASAVTGSLPVSPKAQRVINQAIVRAQELQQERVTTRLALLALLEEPDTLLRDALRAGGVDVDQLTRKLAEKPEFPEE